MVDNYGSDNTVEFQKYPQGLNPVVTATNGRIFCFMVVTKGIELRLDPTKAQGVFFNKCIGAERVIKKFQTQWRPAMLQDISQDNPFSESLLGTWGMKDDGTLGLLGLRGSLGATMENSKPCIEQPINSEIMLRLVLVRKH